MALTRCGEDSRGGLTTGKVELAPHDNPALNRSPFAPFPTVLIADAWHLETVADTGGGGRCII